MLLAKSFKLQFYLSIPKTAHAEFPILGWFSFSSDFWSQRTNFYLDIMNTIEVSPDHLVEDSG